MAKILIAAPVHNRDWVLPAYLEALEQLETKGHEVYYFFLVNNSTDNSEALIKTFCDSHPSKAAMAILNDETPADERYKRDAKAYRHFQVIREAIRKQTLNGKFDYLLSVDTDILIRADTLLALLSHQVDFVAATLSNRPDGDFSTVNAYDLLGGGIGPYRDLAKWVIHKTSATGLASVGATGACFLASRKALTAGAYDFLVLPYSAEAELLSQVTGEDEWFALALLRAGIRQYLDQGHRLYHCMTKARLTAYQNEREKYGVNTPKVLAERDYFKGCAECQNKKRKSNVKK